MKLSISEITVDRESRQRKTIDVSDLIPSIKARGLLHPIVVEKTLFGYKLVAGERRLTACKELGWTDIPVSLREDLSDNDRRLIELEENIKRQDLTWQERAKAIADIHAAYSAEAGEEGWSQERTAERIGMTQHNVSDALAVAEELKSGNERVANAQTRQQALHTIRRSNDRAIAAAMETLMAPPAAEVVTPESKVLLASDSIINTDFHAWAEAYSGPRFSFLHCDFPYGVELQKSDQGNLRGHEVYADQRNVFYDLCTTLVKFQDRLLASSCSMMFWFDMAQYESARQALAGLNMELYPIPLIWYKSDNKGILSDPARRARHIYEVAFYGHRGDMKSVQAISDVYACHVEKDEHLSLKPEPMLRNFFRMFVDPTTTMLDPTCGSGSSLRAAESLGAKFVLGLELNPTTAESARQELQIFRNKRALAAMVEKKS